MTLPSILRYPDDAERRRAPSPHPAAFVVTDKVFGHSSLEAGLAVAVDLGADFLEFVAGVVEVAGECQDGIVDFLDEFTVGLHRGILESSGAGGRITGCPFSALDLGWGPCSISFTQYQSPFGSYCPWVVIRRQHEHQRVLYISCPLCPRRSYPRRAWPLLFPAPCRPQSRGASRRGSSSSGWGIRSARLSGLAVSGFLRSSRTLRQPFMLSYPFAKSEAAR